MQSCPEVPVDLPENELIGVIKGFQETLLSNSNFLPRQHRTYYNLGFVHTIHRRESRKILFSVAALTDVVCVSP